jgi:hypothetical protein
VGDGSVAALAVAGVLVGLAFVGIGVKSLEKYHPWKQVKGLAAAVWLGFVVLVLAGLVVAVGKLLGNW